MGKHSLPRAWLNSYLVVDAAIIVGFAVAVVVRDSRHWLPGAVLGQQGDVYIVLSTVAATLLGFMIAATTILLTVGGRRLTETFVGSDLYPQTLGLFHVTAVWLCMLVFVAIAGLFIDSPPAAGHSISSRNEWIWPALAAAAVASWRFVFSLLILKDVADLVAKDRQAPRTPPPSERPPDQDLTAAVT